MISSALNIVRFMRWSDTSVKAEFGMLIYARCEQDKIDRSIFEVHPFLSAWSCSKSCKAEDSEKLRLTKEGERVSDIMMLMPLL